MRIDYLSITPYKPMKDSRALFELDNLDIEIIKKALGHYELKIQREMDFYNSNGIRCPFVTANAIRHIHRAMGRISNPVEVNV